MDINELIVMQEQEFIIYKAHNNVWFIYAIFKAQLFAI